MDSISALVRKAEDNYVNGYNNIGKYVKVNMYDIIQKIDAYHYSQFTGSQTDSLDRPKPFFNIVTAAENIWYRATDIDRKDIVVQSDKNEDEILAFVCTVLLQNWMIKERFGTFLNQWGRSLARYGSVVVKFVEQDGRLIPSVCNWNRLIVDPVDFSAAPVIEKFYMTPAQLRQHKEYDKDVVENLIETASKATRKNQEDQQIDNRDDYIEIYEVHGELPLALLKDNPTEKDETTYRQQMHVVSYVNTGEKDDQGKDVFDDFTLFKGPEAKSPYMLTHLIPEDDRTLSIGAVEYLFDAQWMMNHTVKAMKDYLDLASKMIFQTADPNFRGRNALKSIETGAILTHAQNSPLTQVNNNAMNLGALLSYAEQWRSLGRENSATPDASRGVTPPSGTPYSTVAALLQESNSLFEVMTENKGFAIEDMLREFIIPFLKKQMDTSEEIAGILEDYQITQIDSLYVPKEVTTRVNQKLAARVANLKFPTSEEQMMMMQEETAQIQEEFAKQGNKRFFKPSEISTKTWKKLLKDFEWNVRVQITNEFADKKIELQTIGQMFRDAMQFGQMIDQNPKAQFLYNKLLTRTGVASPIELSSLQSAPQPQPMPVVPNGGTRVGAGMELAGNKMM